MSATKREKMEARDDGDGIRWAALPSDLIHAVARRLETRDDILHFRQVCNHWRHSTPLSLLRATAALHPLLPLNIPGESRFFPDRSLKLVASSVYLLRPIDGATNHPWLATVEEFNHGKLLLRLPLSRTPLLRTLPPDVVVESDHGYSLLPSNFPAVFDLSNFRVTRLFQGYCLRCRDDSEEMFLEKKLSDHLICKVVLFVNPGSRRSPLSNLASFDDCQVIVLDTSGSILSLSLENREDSEGEESCRSIRASPLCMSNVVGFQYDDIVCFSNKVYAVDRKGGTYYLKYGSTTMVYAAKPIRKNGSGYWRKWLVEFDGGLYLIDRYNLDDTVKFEVYELDVKGVCWNRVMSLGDDRILFVTYDGAFSADVKDFPGWRGNCVVYYTGGFSPSDYYCSLDGLGGDWSSKDLVLAVYYFDDSEDAPSHAYSGLHHITDCENYGKLFWPPPAWVN